MKIAAVQADQGFQEGAKRMPNQLWPYDSEAGPAACVFGTPKLIGLSSGKINSSPIAYGAKLFEFLASALTYHPEIFIWGAPSRVLKHEHFMAQVKEKIPDPKSAHLNP